MTERPAGVGGRVLEGCGAGVKRSQRAGGEPEQGQQRWERQAGSGGHFENFFFFILRAVRRE